MSEHCLKGGYTGYDRMGKPIPLHHRQAAYETCMKYGLDEKTAKSIIKKMVKLLVRNKPHEALLAVREFESGFTINKVYQLIYVLMTGKS